MLRLALLLVVSASVALAEAPVAVRRVHLDVRREAGNFDGAEAFRLALANTLTQAGQLVMEEGGDVVAARVTADCNTGPLAGVVVCKVSARLSWIDPTGGLVVPPQVVTGVGVHAPVGELKKGEALTRAHVDRALRVALEKAAAGVKGPAK